MQKPTVLSNQLIEFYRKPYTVVTLELILTVGLTALLAIMIIRPTLTTMSDLSREIKEKKELSQKLEKKAAALATAQAAYYGAQNQLEQLESAIPSQDTLVTDLKTIERMAGENAVVLTNLGVQGVRVQPESPTSSPSAMTTTQKTDDSLANRLPLSVTVEGDYVSIRNFVENLINYRRLFVVESVVFSINKQQSNQALSASLILDTPYSLIDYEK